MKKWVVTWVLLSSLVVWNIVSEINTQNTKTKLAGVLSWEKIGQWKNKSLSEKLLWLVVSDVMADEKQYALTYEFFNVSWEKISKEGIDEVNRMLWEIEREFGEDGILFTKLIIEWWILNYDNLTKYLISFYNRLWEGTLQKILNNMKVAADSKKIEFLKERYISILDKKFIAFVNMYKNNDK